jgi:hypothetical protein
MQDFRHNAKLVVYPTTPKDVKNASTWFEKFRKENKCLEICFLILKSEECHSFEHLLASQSLNWLYKRNLYDTSIFNMLIDLATCYERKNEKSTLQNIQICIATALARSIVRRVFETYGDHSSVIQEFLSNYGGILSHANLLSVITLIPEAATCKDAFKVIIRSCDVSPSILILSDSKCVVNVLNQYYLSIFGAIVVESRSFLIMSNEDMNSLISILQVLLQWLECGKAPERNLNTSFSPNVESNHLLMMSCINNCQHWLTSDVMSSVFKFIYDLYLSPCNIQSNNISQNHLELTEEHGSLTRLCGDVCLLCYVSPIHSMTLLYIYIFLKILYRYLEHY